MDSPSESDPNEHMNNRPTIPFDTFLDDFYQKSYTMEKYDAAKSHYPVTEYPEL